MEPIFESSSIPDSPPAFSTAKSVDASTILIVEDDADVRDMLTTLMDLAGFACVPCDSAEAGLKALRDRPVDMILTDYSLPQHTGVWLLERAEAEGLIQGTPVMIVTAHPDPTGASTYEIVQKPFDLDELVGRVRQRMGEKGARRRKPAAAPPAKAPGGRQHQREPEGPDPIELILYVSTQARASAAGIRNLEKVLSRFNSSRAKLTVCELSAHSSEGADQAVAHTPTLVRHSPGPRTYILGHATHPDLVLQLLTDCEPDDQ